MSVLKETWNAFSSKTTAKSENEVVVMHTPGYARVPECHSTLIRVNPRYLALHKLDSALVHCVAQVKGNVIKCVVSKGEVDQMRIENKSGTAREQCNLVFGCQIL